MVEILTPLGVIAPVACAAFGYFKLGAIRRRQINRQVDGPKDLGV